MRKILIGAVVVGAISFGYYAVSPFFRHIKVDEPVPVSVLEEGGPRKEIRQPVAPAAKIQGTAGHPASGEVRLVETEGKTYVRYENLKTINGPDIYIYLSKNLDAKDIVSLGRVKATEGNVNYEVPAGTDVSDYPYVLTWCEQFGVLFNHARLN